jgi:hypothetical protein
VGRQQAKRDKKAPYVFTTAGKLKLPSGVTAKQGCTGTVKVSRSVFGPCGPVSM